MELVSAATVILVVEVVILFKLTVAPGIASVIVLPDLLMAIPLILNAEFCAVATSERFCTAAGSCDSKVLTVASPVTAILMLLALPVLLEDNTSL